MKRSVYIFGWSTIIVSAILIFSAFLSLMLSDSVSQMTGLLKSYPQSGMNSLDWMTDMFEYNRVWSVYSIVYFLATLIGGIQFVRFREVGRRILEIACWVGILNACVDSIANYVFWENMETSMKSLAGGMGMSLSQLNPLGAGTVIAGFLLWVVPSIGIIVYLRRPSLKALMIQKGVWTNKESLNPSR